MFDTNKIDLVKPISEATPDNWREKALWIVVGIIFGVIGKEIHDCLVSWWTRLWLDLEFPSANRSTCDLRIVNNSRFHMKDCWAYITIHDLDKADIGNPPVLAVTEVDKDKPKAVPDPHIWQDSEVALNEDRLAWSLDAGGKNEPKSDICPGERQALTLLKWHDLYQTHFSLASETAHATPRIYLRMEKTYHGTLKIVSPSIRARSWKITIDPNNRTLPISKTKK